MNNKPKQPVQTHFFTFILWFLFFLIMLNVAKITFTDDGISNKISFNEFVSLVKSNQVESVTFEGNQKIIGVLKSPNGVKSFETIGDTKSEAYVNLLLQNNIVPNYKEEQKPSVWFSLLINFAPMLILLFVFFYIFNRAKSGAGGISNFGKIRTKTLNEESKLIKFSDVAGVDESKEELYELVDFLRDPKKFTSIGAKIPKGALLVGPPGTGKTMLARAVASEAGVPFISISGSDFVEMFVGVGASRVRDLFDQARAKAPCIIFIDEIDAVGKSRGNGGINGGGNDEREQTLNQLLVEMDGFDVREGIIILAATNRAEVLDPALLRPGRFDRRIIVQLPDVVGREKILAIHGKKVNMGADVNLHSLARGTSGFSGADLANLINEAALLSGRRNKVIIEQSELEEARDKILMGPQRKSMKINEEEKKTTAYHEAGHTILAVELKTDPIHKVTIIPRGMALGVTQTLPEENQLSLSKEKAEKLICMLMGGRIAEEIVFNHFTTGASNDIERATQLARRMVTEWGMSSLGPINYKNENNGMNLYAEFSESTRKEVDDEIKKIINECYNKAKNILITNRDKLEKLSLALIEKETLDSQEVMKLLS